MTAFTNLNKETIEKACKLIIDDHSTKQENLQVFLFSGVMYEDH